MDDRLGCQPGGRRPAGAGCAPGTAARPGRPAAPAVVLRSPLALRRDRCGRPGELGLARAYISGDLDVEGDLTEGLRRVVRRLALVGSGRARPWAGEAGPVGRAVDETRPAIAASRLGAFGPPPAPPPARSGTAGRPHSRARDQGRRSPATTTCPVSFYRLILDPSMAYSCGYWASDDAGYGLADAQRDKLDLVCGEARSLAPAARCSTWAAAGDRSRCTPRSTARRR